MKKYMLTAAAFIACLSFLSPARAQDTICDLTPDLARDLKTPVYKWYDPDNKAPRGAVLLIHGFPEHGALYEHLAGKLVKDGLVVYAPDMRGLGRAWDSGVAPRLEYVRWGDEDLALLATRIRAEHRGLPLIVGGESMGGAFSIRLAARHPDLVDGVILSGAAIKLEHHYLSLLPQGAMNLLFPRRKVDFSGQIRRFFSSDPRIAADLLNDPLVRTHFDVDELTQCKQMTRDTVRLVGAIPARIPVLVLQAVDDRQTPVSSLNIFDAKLKSRDQTIVLFSPRGHVLLQTNRMQQDVEDAVRNWITKRVPAGK